MDYTVSGKIRSAFDEITALPQVRQAMDFLEKDHPFSIAEHKMLIACEAPTFQERKRAELFAEKLKEYGLTEVRVDEYNNAWGYRRGCGKGPTLLVEAHLDTVFPFGSVTEIRDESGEIHAPGAVDNTRGLSVILAVIRAMDDAGLRTSGDIVFCGTAREEGMGSLGGMRDFLEHGPGVDAAISVDGASTERVTCDATGYYTYAIHFHGIGGHAFGAFGQVANPLHAAARAVAKISDFQVPSDPKTTFCVSNFHSGNDAGVHAIASEATIKINIRSNDMAELLKLNDRVFKAVQEACDEETARWGRDTITWDSEQFCDVPAGTQDHHAPLVEAAFLAASRFTPKEFAGNVGINQGGCVNGNIALGKGLPCVTIGGGSLDRNIHRIDEFFPYETAYRLPQELFVLLCMASGVEGKTDSVLNG